VKTMTGRRCQAGPSLEQHVASVGRFWSPSLLTWTRAGAVACSHIASTLPGGCQRLPRSSEMGDSGGDGDSMGARRMGRLDSMGAADAGPTHMPRTLWQLRAKKD
jgi:hypothetical protein